MSSIRSHLLRGQLLGAAVVLSIAGVASYIAVSGALERQFERQVRARAEALASLLFQQEDEVWLEFSGELMPEYEREGRPAYFGVATRGSAEWSLLELSDSLAAHWPLESCARELLEPLEGRPQSSGPRAEFGFLGLPDGRPGARVLLTVEVHHVYPEEGPLRPDARTARILVAVGTEALRSDQRRILWLSASGAVALLLALIGVSRRVVSRGLAPLERLGAQVRQLHPDSEARGVSEDDLPQELQPLAETIDDLLGRTRSAVLRERRTTRDIAHELRTPISEVLLAADVVLRQGESSREAREALEMVRDSARSMGRSVGALLKLARIEMGQEELVPERVDLALQLRSTIERWSNAALERGMRWRVLAPDGVGAWVDPELLEILLSNLVGNAVHHAPEGSSLTARIEPGGAKRTWSLEILNPSEELLADELELLTQPLWRKQTSRSDRERSGLGLALCQALVDRAGWRLEFSWDTGAFRARLSESGSNAEPEFLRQPRSTSTSPAGSVDGEPA